MILISAMKIARLKKTLNAMITLDVQLFNLNYYNNFYLVKFIDFISQLARYTYVLVCSYH